MRTNTLQIFAGLACAFAASISHGHSGDHSFLDQNYKNATQAQLEKRKSAAGTDLRQSIRARADLLSTVRNSEGATLLPEGTKCDTVTITPGNLTLYFTLPTSTPRKAFTPSVPDTVSAVFIREYLEPLQLQSVKVFARIGEKDEYRDLSAYQKDIPPVPAPAPELSPDMPDAPPITAKELARDRNTLNALPEKFATGEGSQGTGSQPTGGLSGRVVFLSPGHGATNDGAGWYFQRSITNGMIEDLGNLDQMNVLATYLFNAGATVVPLRPIGFQTNEVIVDDAAATFSPGASWSTSTNTDNYGGSGARFATVAATETATATFVPNIPAAGIYPVYCYANASTNRVSGQGQLYKIVTPSGTTNVRINHSVVGRGWVWLGSYYFNQGSNPATGAVVVSNLEPSGTYGGTIVMADAIRFGNGNGDIARGSTPTISGTTREAEICRYWLQESELPASVYDISGFDDGDDDIGARGRAAAFMLQDATPLTDPNVYNRALFLSMHSNAFDGSARGSVALITSSGSPAVTNQATFAALLSNELDADAVVEDADWEFTWFDRASATLTGAYGEISNSALNEEMCGSLTEIAFHDNSSDAALLRDPKVRYVAARATYKAVVKYFNQFNSGLATYLPEPPTQIRAVNTPGGVVLNWAAGPTGSRNGGAATGYRVYRSLDGLSWQLIASPATTTHTDNSGLVLSSEYYYRVSATNAGGESMPSRLVGVRRAVNTAPILVVNAYDRLDRFNNILYSSSFSGGNSERQNIRRNNSFDYIRLAGSAIASSNRNFDSCDHSAISAGLVSLGGYHAVVWMCGEDSTGDQTFDANERTAITNYLAGTGRLFTSGAEIGWELDQGGISPSFYNNQLRADYVGDDGGSYQVTGVAGTFMAGIVANFNPGPETYDADYPDQLGVANSSVASATYTGGGSGNAAVQFPSGTTNGKIVTFGFPFETINTSSSRNSVMTAVLNFFTTPTAPNASVRDWSLF